MLIAFEQTEHHWPQPELILIMEHWLPELLPGMLDLPLLVSPQLAWLLILWQWRWLHHQKQDHQSLIHMVCQDLE